MLARAALRGRLFCACRHRAAVARTDCGYRKCKISRNGGALRLSWTEIVAEMIPLGSKNVLRTSAVLESGRTPR